MEWATQIALAEIALPEAPRKSVPWDFSYRARNRLRATRTKLRLVMLAQSLNPTVTLTCNRGSRQIETRIRVDELTHKAQG
jgi:hypothetical protein